jgi:hypothetical protein
MIAVSSSRVGEDAASYHLWEFDNPDVALTRVELSEITGGAKYSSAVAVENKGTVEALRYACEA